jgi:hypothetical protein
MDGNILNFETKVCEVRVEEKQFMKPIWYAWPLCGGGWWAQGFVFTLLYCYDLKTPQIRICIEMGFCALVLQPYKTFLLTRWIFLACGRIFPKFKQIQLKKFWCNMYMNSPYNLVNCPPHQTKFSGNNNCTTYKWVASVL